MTAISTYDPTTLKLGAALHMRHRHPVFVMFRYLYLAFIPIGALLLYLGDHTFGFLCLMIGPLLFLRKIFWQYRLIQNSKTSPQAGKRLHWTFSEKGFHQKSDQHSSDFTWKQITERHLSPKAILLYLSKEQYFVLPRSSFESQELFEKVSQLVSEKVGVIQSAPLQK